MGAELDPREEGLDVVGRDCHCSILDTSSFSQLALSYVWSRAMPGPKSPGHVFLCLFPFSSFISLSTAIRYQTQLVESFPLLHFSFLYAKLDTGMTMQLTRLSFLEKSLHGFIMGMEGGNDG